jgi:hypothetical protein
LFSGRAGQPAWIVPGANLVPCVLRRAHELQVAPTRESRGGAAPPLPSPLAIVARTTGNRCRSAWQSLPEGLGGRRRPGLEPVPVGLPSAAGRAAALACVARIRRAFARLHPSALASLRLFGRLGPPYRDRLLSGRCSRVPEVLRGWHARCVGVLRRGEAGSSYRLHRRDDSSRSSREFPRGAGPSSCALLRAPKSSELP